MYLIESYIESSYLQSHSQLGVISESMLINPKQAGLFADWYVISVLMVELI